MKHVHISWRLATLIITPSWVLLGITFSFALGDWSIFRDWMGAGAIALVAAGLLICLMKVSLYLGPRIRRFLVRHWRIIGAVGIFLVLLRFAVPSPLAGNYVGSFTDHGCNKRAFLRFADGRITYFHGDLKPVHKGTYERVGWNTYVWQPGGSMIQVGWLFIRVENGMYWLHRDLSSASRKLVEQLSTNAPNKITGDNSGTASADSLSRSCVSQPGVSEF